MSKGIIGSGSLPLHSFFSAMAGETINICFHDTNNKSRFDEGPILKLLVICQTTLYVLALSCTLLLDNLYLQTAVCLYNSHLVKHLG